MIVPSLADLAESIDSVHPYPGNARVGDIEFLTSSLAEHGQIKPIVANRRTGDILAGNHLWQAAVALGWSEIAVTWVDVDEDQARKIVLVDNRASELGGFDDEALAELLDSLATDDLESVGYSQEFLETLLAEVADDDFVPFTEYQGFASEGASPAVKSGGEIASNTEQWVNLRLVDLRIRVSRSAYQSLYERLLRENDNDRAKASRAFALGFGFTPEEVEG